MKEEQIRFIFDDWAERNLKGKSPKELDEAYKIFREGFLTSQTFQQVRLHADWGEKAVWF